MTAWFFLLTMFPNATSCQFVRGEHITGADLARAIPAFAAIPKDTMAGYSPAPGSRRLFQFAELNRIGAGYHVSVPEEAKACFEWKLQTVDESTVRMAMRESLRAPDAQVEILSLSKTLAPEGSIEFPVSGLSAAASVDPATPVLWRGYVSYAKSRRFALWARVRLSITMTRVVATTALLPNSPIAAGQIRLETYEDFPLQNDIARSIEEVVGRLPRRGIRQGLPVFRTDLMDPFLIQRGDQVQVTAISGAAQLQLTDAIAQTSGRQGDLISLKNPRSGKIFRARVEGKGKAIVLAGVGGLVARVQ